MKFTFYGIIIASHETSVIVKSVGFHENIMNLKPRATKDFMGYENSMILCVCHVASSPTLKNREGLEMRLYAMRIW